MINKQISVASLDVEPDLGKIWLNSPNCILRIQNLKFNHVEDKFAMIDIKGEEAFMIPGDLGTSNYTDFLEKLNFIILPKIYSEDDKDSKQFLDSLYSKIKVWAEEI